MVDPVNPVDPSQKVGDGKSPAERMKRGMPNVDPEIQKDFAGRLEKYINEGKAINEARNAYNKNYTGNTRVGGVGGSGGGAGELDMVGMQIKKPTPVKKKGGVIKSSTSKRADGCCTKGHTKGKYL